MIEPSKLPDRDILLRLLDCDFDRGRLTWKVRPATMFEKEHQCRAWNSKWAGREAFTAEDRRGYRRGMILGIQTSAHRIIWKMHSGCDPEFIDHIDGNPRNNSISNLRSVKHRQNCQNTRIRSDASSGCTGVSWSNRDRKWRAYIKGDEKVHYLGEFFTKAAAIKARKKAEKKFGYHENHGRSK